VLIGLRGWLRDLDCQPVQLFKRKTNLGLRLGALRKIQFHRGATQSAIGAPHHRNHHLQIARQLHHRRRCRTPLALPLRLQEQLRLSQQAFAHCQRGAAPSRIQLARFAASKPMPRKTLRHAATVFRSQPCHRHQELHRHMRRDRAAAHLLLHARRQQFNQAHPPRDPAHAAIKSSRQLLLGIAEALLQVRQQPTLFQGRGLLAGPHRAIQEQGLGLAQRPDHRLDRVPAKLLQRPDSPVAIDEQIPLGLIHGDNDDRRLLSTGRQRSQQPLLPLRPVHTQVLQTPLKLVKFQLHDLPPLRLYPASMRLAGSGIAHWEPVVSLDLSWNQRDTRLSGIAWSAALVQP
jgi:hypothetical protein